VGDRKFSIAIMAIESYCDHFHFQSLIMWWPNPLLVTMHNRGNSNVIKIFLASILMDGRWRDTWRKMAMSCLFWQPWLIKVWLNAQALHQSLTRYKTSCNHVMWLTSTLLFIYIYFCKFTPNFLINKLESIVYFAISCKILINSAKLPNSNDQLRRSIFLKCSQISLQHFKNKTSKAS
jgi:hypothetical protein